MYVLETPLLRCPFRFWETHECVREWHLIVRQRTQAIYSAVFQPNSHNRRRPYYEAGVSRMEAGVSFAERIQ